MKISRRSVLAAAIALPVVHLLPGVTAAGDNLTIRRMYTRDGLALSGYDAVAYFEDGRPELGHAAHRLRWRGAIWQFASADHRQAFEMNPRAYAPQFGGYCAYTVAEGSPIRADPELWTIHDGRLYLNHDSRLQGLWRQDMAQAIAAARKNWAGFGKI